MRIYRKYADERNGIFEHEFGFKFRRYFIGVSWITNMPDDVQKHIAIYCCKCNRHTPHIEVKRGELDSPFDYGLHCLICGITWDAEVTRKKSE